MVKTLYSIIGELGKDKIQRDITLNIEKSRQYIEMILIRCCRIPDFTTVEIIGSLCEALLHFMLTASTIPSVRKVRCMRKFPRIRQSFIRNKLHNDLCST